SELRCKRVPPPRTAIEPAMIRLRRNGPTKLTASTRSRSSHSVSTSRRSVVGPRELALWISTSIGPTRSAAVLDSGWIAVLSPMSALSACASAPCSRSSFASRSSGSRSRATNTNRAPAAASCRDSAAPSPRLAPVIRTALPSSVMNTSCGELGADVWFDVCFANVLSEGYAVGMPEPLSHHLGHNVRVLRQARGHTQQQMAKLSRLPRATWANIESGAANPTLAVLHRVAVALQVSIEELVATPRADVKHYPKGSLPERERGEVRVSSLMPDEVPGMHLECIELLARSRLIGGRR